MTVTPIGLFAFYALLVGLVVGSYLNVVIHRLPRGMSTVRPRSRCPRCDRQVRARDNIPVLSYLLLRGRCRDCKAPIHWRYPLVEAATAALFVASVLRFGVSVDALAAAIFCALMLSLAMIDAEHYILPDRLTLPGVVVGLALSPWVSWLGLGTAFLGAALGAGILGALWGGWYLLRGEEGMGLGDIKMLALVGAFLGWRGVLVTLFFGALSGAVVGVALISRGDGSMKTKLPFGTFLAAAALLALFAGQEITSAYFDLL